MHLCVYVCVYIYIYIYIYILHVYDCDGLHNLVNKCVCKGNHKELVSIIFSNIKQARETL